MARVNRQEGESRLVLTHRAAAFAWGRIESLDAPRIVGHQEGCPPSCFNPRHLVIWRDRAEAARNQAHRARGERNSRAKLTRLEVLAVASLVTEGQLTDEEIARWLNDSVGKNVCSPRMVEDIRLKKTWAHLWDTASCPPATLP